MPRTLQYTFGFFLCALLVAAPWTYAWHRNTQLRNFHIVQEGLLYRSAQLPLDGLKRIIHDYGIKTVVTLRDAHPGKEGPPDRKEEEYCTKEDIQYVRISPRDWWAPDGSTPAEEGIHQFLELMKDARNYPVLIHCFAGVHRTGAYCAVWRMEHDGWTNEQAINELVSFGYENLPDEWDILGYLEQYRPSWQPRDPNAPAVRRRPPVRPGKRGVANERRDSGAAPAGE
jgi:tyrosine-protein phosphatase SIW14